MGKRGYVAVAVLSIVVGATLSAVVAQASHPWDANPFFGSSTGESTGTFIPPTGPVTGSSTGEFTATHLGNGTYTSTTTQDYGRHIEGERPARQGQCAFVDGTITLTAANGDNLEVNLDADRSVVCAPDTQPPGTVAVGEVYESTLFGVIVGGTGRFTDAQGYIFSEGTSTVTAVNGLSTTTADEADIYGDIQI